MSNRNGDRVLAMDLLKVQLDDFVRNVREDPHAWTTSAYFPHPDQEQVEELEDYAIDKGYRVRLKCDNHASFWQYPHDIIDAPGQVMSFTFFSNNIQRAEFPFEPMDILGFGNTVINGTICQSNLKAMIIDRNDPSPNFMMEIRYLDRYTDAQFHSRLISYITGTPGVMIVLGISIMESNEQGAFEALAIVYERTEENLPTVAYNVSFGTAEISPAHAAAWTDGAQDALTAVTPGALVPPLVGVGMGSPSCTDATCTAAPYLIKLRQDLLLATNFSVPYKFHPKFCPVYGLDFELKLCDIQRVVNRRLQELRRWGKL
jgi:hypothetical protein